MTLHQAVLLKESVCALVTNPGGHYVDCTYGRGGHSRAIVAALAPGAGGVESADGAPGNQGGRLLVIDRDSTAIDHARAQFAGDERVVVAHGAFSAIAQLAATHSFQPLDGVLMDLGMSSPQLDDGARGFSFDQSGPLDMRMNQQEGQTAAEWLARASESEIAGVLRRYGEERFARRIARHLVEARRVEPVTTTRRLVEIVEAAVPRPVVSSRSRRKPRGAPGHRVAEKHPATRTFQAIRIHINQELQELETCLKDVVSLLNAGGRIVVISFHSLEDRFVKRFFRQLAGGDIWPRRLPVRESALDKKLRLVGKPVRASAAEVTTNRRARSAIMRVAERLG